MLTIKATADARERQVLDVSKALLAVASDLQLNMGLTYVKRRSPLPFHCEVAQRLQRWLHFPWAEMVDR